MTHEAWRTAAAAERARWTERWLAEGAGQRAPSRWVLEQCGRLPDSDLLVDLACGLGRHAVPLAKAGRTVVAVDFVEEAVRATAAASPRVLGVVADLRALPLRDGTLDAVVIVNFLHRELMPALVRLLRTGGTLIYETYTVAHAELVDAGRARGPTDPAYMLEPGELVRLVTPLAVVAEREGLVHDDAGERFVAGVVGVREAIADRNAAPGT